MSGEQPAAPAAAPDAAPAVEPAVAPQVVAVAISWPHRTWRGASSRRVYVPLVDAALLPYELSCARVDEGESCTTVGAGTVRVREAAAHMQRLVAGLRDPDGPLSTGDAPFDDEDEVTVTLWLRDEDIDASPMVVRHALSSRSAAGSDVVIHALDAIELLI